jgi:uncharacterized membrane protein YheB (UPF0754 family)
MPFVPVEFAPYLKYLGPPVVGAFIGYVTNHVAIRMLFRPLHKWRVLGIPVPMTPGVIPSKRRELARNMGEMVGDHLLTSTEIGKALQEEKFQRHLLGMIEERVNAVMHADLGALPTLIPGKFTAYFDIAVKTIKYQVKENVRSYIQSPAFQTKVENSIDQRLDHFLQQQVGTVFTGRERETTYTFLETTIARMLTSPAMEEWLLEFIQQKVYETMQQHKSLAQILPDSLLEFLQTTLQEQTPALLKKTASVLQEPEVRDKIVGSACKAVENFIASLGPMAMMVGNFLSMEVVEAKIRSYLDGKEEDIAAWLSSEEVQLKVAALLAERFAAFSRIPLVELIPKKKTEHVDEFCVYISGQIALLLKSRDVATALTAMIKGTLESHLEEGNVSVRNVLTDFIGETGIHSTKGWIREECLTLLRSRGTLQTLDSMIETMTDALLQKRIGKLSNLLPGGVRDSISLSLQKMALNMLEREVPGLVASLQLSKVVTVKVDSLDLLRLERLLLSIMEEQFKYINLFGGLLGFLIGCFNLLLL